MKLTRAVLTVALLIGLAASVAAYRSASASIPTQQKSPVSLTESKPGPQAVHPGARFKWAPCPPKATLEKGVCVVDVVQTIVIPAPPVAVPASSPASSSGSSSSGGGGAPAAHQGGDDGGGDGGEDQAEPQEHENEHEDGEDQENGEDD